MHIGAAAMAANMPPAVSLAQHTDRGEGAFAWERFMTESRIVHLTVSLHSFGRIGEFVAFGE
jgi:hypothetical protein